jgi:hypothetical protein
MHQAYLQYLQSCARDGGFSVLPNAATFNLSKSPQAQGVLPCAVYGVAAVLNDGDASALEDEAKAKGSLKTPLSAIARMSFGSHEAIPLYWGKDAALGFRLYRHILDQNPKAGCLGARFYRALANVDLLVASVPVNDAVGFERYMEQKHTPMLWNARSASLHAYIRVAP